MLTRIARRYSVANQRGRWTGTALITVTLGFLLGMIAHPAHAMSLDHYDLDSLVYMSELIVEGTVRDFPKEPAYHALIEVEQSYRGGSRRGATVKVVALDFFRTSDPKSYPLNVNPLAAR